MAQNKTTFTTVDVQKFIDVFANTAQKKNDSFILLTLLEELTGEEAKMWGPSIVGFGNYHYQYASGHEGDAPILAFSPRKAAISLYVYSDTEKSRNLLTQLGKFKMGKACIYINKLADIDLSILKALCQESINYIQAHHECACKRT